MPPGSTTASFDDTISLLDLLRVLVKRRWLILGVTAVAAVSIFAYALLTTRLPPTSAWNHLPNIYRPEVRVLLLDTGSSPSLSSALGGGDAGLAGLAGLLGVQSGNTSAELAQQLLTGRTIQDQIAAEFDFTQRYELEENPRTKARRIISGALEYEYDDGSNVLTVTYSDVDPQFATDVLARAVALLEARFRSLTMETVLQKKRFLEERLEAVGAERAAAQNALIAFQREYGILDIGSQSEQTVALIAQFKREVLSKEVEMQGLRDYLPANDPSVQQLSNEIAVLRQLIEELQTGFQEFSGQAIPQAELPRLGAEYLNLVKDVQIVETVYALLRQQYETTRIEETDTSHTFQVLEHAEVPEVKYRPSRGRICIVVTLAAFFVAVLLAFSLEYFARASTDPEEAAKLAEIRRMLWHRRGSGPAKTS